MFGFLFGLTIGVVSTYFVMRFKSALKVWLNRAEADIEKTLKGGQ